MFLFGREYKWHCNHIRINPYLHILQISDSVFLFHNKSRWTTWKMHRRRINSKNETQGQSCFAIYRYIFHKSVLSCLSNFRLQLKMFKSNCRLPNYVEYGHIKLARSPDLTKLSHSRHFSQHLAKWSTLQIRMAKRFRDYLIGVQVHHQLGASTEISYISVLVCPWREEGKEVRPASAKKKGMMTWMLMTLTMM